MPAAFPLMRDTLDGTTASGEYEARLGREEFGKEVHVYAPAYDPGRGRAPDRHRRPHLFQLAGADRALSADREGERGVEVGMRINPGYSNATLGGALYDPCAPCSRFGTTREEIDKLPWDEIDIFHVHALCESLADGSVGLIEHVAREFEPYLRRVKAVNFGGGHFINKPGYDVDKLDRGHQGLPRRVRRRGHSRARRRPGRRHRLSRRDRHRPAPEREGHRHPRCVGLDATCPTCSRCPTRRPSSAPAEPGVHAAQLHSRRQDLHDRRHHRRVFVPASPCRSATASSSAT